MQTSTGNNQVGSNSDRTRQYFNSLCRRSPSNHHKLESAVKASQWISLPWLRLKMMQTLAQRVEGEGRFLELILEKRIAPLRREGAAWSAKSDKNSELACSSCVGLGQVPSDLLRYWLLTLCFSLSTSIARVPDQILSVSNSIASNKL